MKVDKNESIADVSIVALRNAFRRFDRWDTELFTDVLGISDDQAQDLISALLAEGFIEVESGDGYGVWELTTKGRSLANVSFSPRVHRSTADRALRDFLDRVDEVNRDNHWLMKVSRAVVFGSYLDPEVERLGDVDIGLALEWKEQDPSARDQLIRQYLQRAKEQGRTFPTFFAEISAPQVDIWRFLRSRSRTLKLHLIEDPEMLGASCEEIFVNGERVGIGLSV